MAQDTRKDKRATLDSLVVRYKSATVDEFIENHSHDVSAGGLFVQTEAPFTAGTLLKFEIRIGDDKSVIVGVGRVVWKRDTAAPDGRPPGMGVKFIKIDDPSKALIRSLVDKNAGAGSEYQVGLVPGSQSTDAQPAQAAAPAPAAPAAPAPAAPAPVQASAPVTKDLPAAAAPLVASPAAAPKLAEPAAAPAARSTFASRKSTMLGIGAVSAEAIAAAAAEKANAAAKPERPQGLSFSVPTSEGFQEHEPTVMKQAAELLAEALREAGGSMEEVGQNPLFSGAPKRAETPSAAPPPVAPPVEAAPATVPLVPAVQGDHPDTRRVSDVLGETMLEAGEGSPKAAPVAAAEAVEAVPATKPAETTKAATASTEAAAVAAVAADGSRGKREPFKTKVSASAPAPVAPAAEPARSNATWAIAVVIVLAGLGVLGAWKSGLLGGQQTTVDPVTTPAPSSVQVLPPASALGPVVSVNASAEPEPAASAPKDAGLGAGEPVSPAAAVVPSAKPQPAAKPYVAPVKPTKPKEPEGEPTTPSGTSGGTAEPTPAPKPAEPAPTPSAAPAPKPSAAPAPKPVEPELQ